MRQLQTSDSRLLSIQWAQHAAGTAIQYVSVDLRGCYIGMTQQFLNRADIVAGLQQMGGE